MSEFLMGVLFLSNVWAGEGFQSDLKEGIRYATPVVVKKQREVSLKSLEVEIQKLADKKDGELRAKNCGDPSGKNPPKECRKLGQKKAHYDEMMSSLKQAQRRNQEFCSMISESEFTVPANSKITGYVSIADQKKTAHLKWSAKSFKVICPQELSLNVVEHIVRNVLGENEITEIYRGNLDKETHDRYYYGKGLKDPSQIERDHLNRGNK